MENNDKFVQDIIKKSIFLIAFEILVSLLLFDDKLPIILGFVIGGGLAIVFFRIIYLIIIVALGKTESKAKRFITINYVIRYIIYAFVLYLGHKTGYYNIFSTALGFLTIKLVLYIDNIISLIKGRKKIS